MTAINQASQRTSLNKQKEKCKLIKQNNSDQIKKLFDL